MTTLAQVKDYSQLRKDTANGGVVNVDKNAYKAHKIAKEVAKKNLAERKIHSESIQNMQQEINSIKDDISDVKEMLLALINKGK